MELNLHSPPPLPSKFLTPKLFLLNPHHHSNHRRTRHSRQNSIFRVTASTNDNGFGFDKFSESFRRGSERFLFNFGELVKRETGFDLNGVNVKVSGFVGDSRKKGEVAFQRLRSEVIPQFVEWNDLQHWKDVKSWGPKRIGVLMLYVFVLVLSFKRMYRDYRSPRLDRQGKEELTEAFMEALIPEPTPSNIRKFKKGMWRKTMPKGLKMKKFIEGPDGTLVRDESYVGEDAWDDVLEPLQKTDAILNLEEKKKSEKDATISGGEDEEVRKSWRERFSAWQMILRKDKLTEQLESLNAKYVVDFDMQEVENSLRKDVVEKVSDTKGSRALWISKRWWRYRPNLPYSYFLNKLDCSEVAAVVFTEDLKKLYVTMKEGFPLEYVVDIPLDPYLFETISSSGAEVDLLQKRQLSYILRVVVALVPGILILYFIRESVMLLHITSKRYLYKRYNQLFDMAYAENFILPAGDGETKSMYKDVVLGGDVWDLLDELMVYMGNPMQYYERQVPFVRGVLLSGPPGTGKTLFARTLAKESGMPFVFASGAEFTDSEKSGVARINELFSIARRNAPSFVFIDEIDAIAGRHARKDPRRRATFEALIAQLDGECVFLSSALIFIQFFLNICFRTEEKRIVGREIQVEVLALLVIKATIRYCDDRICRGSKERSSVRDGGSIVLKSKWRHNGIFRKGRDSGHASSWNVSAYEKRVVKTNSQVKAREKRLDSDSRVYCGVEERIPKALKVFYVSFEEVIKSAHMMKPVVCQISIPHALESDLWHTEVDKKMRWRRGQRKEKIGVDRFSLRQAVIFICATNRPDELDLEFVRSGRIDRRLHIGLPDAKQRIKIFGVHSAGKQIAHDVDFEKASYEYYYNSSHIYYLHLAQSSMNEKVFACYWRQHCTKNVIFDLVFRTVGYSGADIRNLVNEAGIMAVRKGHPNIYQKDIVDVLDKQLLEGMGVLLTEEEQQKCEESVPFEKKKLLAVHEAGHILLAHMFPRFDWHAFSQLLPGGKETAISVFYPREDMVDQGYTTFGYMKMQMVVAHGGRCAERVVFGDDITDGGKDDLEKITKVSEPSAQEIAREMVISPRNSRLGLSALVKRVRLMDKPDNPDGELINYKWDEPHVIPADMSLEVSELFTRELTRYIEETEELAMIGLKQNRHILDMIANELLEQSRITGLEVEKKLRDFSPIMFKDFAQPFQINLEEVFFFDLTFSINYGTKKLCSVRTSIVGNPRIQFFQY
ncbi:hypothetical protein GIB67_031853 [Kingdonia uniflora]|uniref:AAA+ ATPase domain-containing protein n=1 Tax=Kingdonia uniflora TaxID=39325 RepID=A0A7J7L4T7_9MAGN|nr:hypothetical protein GIB67_031853 [Kingdonia uniflora]